MLNKTLIKKNFEKSINTYDKNAFIQDKISSKIIELIEGKSFTDILEIGSYTGILTKKIIDINPNFVSYTAIDIVKDSENFLKKISPKISFLNIDIEKYDTNKKFDLIISSSTLQWCDDFFFVLEKLKSCLKSDGILAVSVFKEGNLFEIKKAFNVELNYPNREDILKLKEKNILSKNAIVTSEEIPVRFSSSKDILKHLKLTGVNSVKKNISVSSTKNGLKILENDFQNKITYMPLYIIDTI